MATSGSPSSTATRSRGSTRARRSPGTSNGITEFAIPTAKAGPAGIATGPDRNLWFAESGQGISANSIGRITPGGTISEFPTPSAASKPLGIAPGPEGDIWFTERSTGELGRIDPGAASPGTSNGITEFSIPTAASLPDYLAPGPDGNPWFAEFGKARVGRIGTGAPAAPIPAPTVSGGGQAGAAQMCNGSWATWASLQPSDSLFGFDGYRWLLDGSQSRHRQVSTPRPQRTSAISSPVLRPSPTHCRSLSARRRRAPRWPSSPKRPHRPAPPPPTITAARRVRLYLASGPQVRPGQQEKASNRNHLLLCAQRAGRAQSGSPSPSVRPGAGSAASAWPRAARTPGTRPARAP